MDNLEWLTRNSLRSFPLTEDAGRVSLNTGWRLPDFLLADAFVVSEDETEGIYVQSVTISKKIVAVVLGSVRTGAAIGTASIIQGQDSPFSSKPIVALSPGVAGRLTFGSALSDGQFAELQKHPGTHVFPTSATLESRSVMNTGPFPVRSIGRPERSLAGAVELLTNSAMAFTVSQGEHDGDPVQIISLGLTNPRAFLSPCENATTPCDCPSIPIHSINGVVPDGSGVIHIEIVDANGSILVMAPDILSFLLTRTGESLCSRPAMPDQYGRLPSIAGYSADEKPTTPYSQAGDDTFPSPVL